MISEKQFASGFAAFWADCLPFFTGQAVAELNLKGEPLEDGYGGLVKPLPSIEKSSNDVAAEAAFGLFVASVNSGADVLSLAEDQQLIGKITSSAFARVLSIRRYWKEKRRNLTTANDEIVEWRSDLRTTLPPIEADDCSLCNRDSRDAAFKTHAMEISSLTAPYMK